MVRRSCCATLVHDEKHEAKACVTALLYDLCRHSCCCGRAQRVEDVSLCLFRQARL
jgi:hypothetical protein